MLLEAHLNHPSVDTDASRGFFVIFIVAVNPPSFLVISYPDALKMEQKREEGGGVSLLSPHFALTLRCFPLIGGKQKRYGDTTPNL